MCRLPKNFINYFLKNHNSIFLNLNFCPSSSVTKYASFTKLWPCKSSHKENAKQILYSESFDTVKHCNMKVIFYNIIHWYIIKLFQLVFLRKISYEKTLELQFMQNHLNIVLLNSRRCPGRHSLEKTIMLQTEILFLSYFDECDEE